MKVLELCTKAFHSNIRVDSTQESSIATMALDSKGLNGSEKQFEQIVVLSYNGRLDRVD